jgi:hypothetical protein
MVEKKNGKPSRKRKERRRTANVLAMLKMLLMLNRLLVLHLSGKESLVSVPDMRLVLGRSFMRRPLAVFGLSMSVRLLELLDVSMVSDDGVVSGLKAVSVVCGEELSAFEWEKGRE